MNSDQQPTTDTPPEGVSPVNEPVPTVDTTDTTTPPPANTGSQPVTPNPAAPVIGSSPKKPKLLAIILIAAVVVLLGGGAAAYKFWYQNPSKVIGDGLTHALTEKGAVTSNGTIAVDSDQADVDLTISGGSLANEATGEGTIKVTLNEGELKGKTFSIKGNGVYKQDGTTYFKVSDVKQVVTDIVDIYVDSLVTQYKALGYTITEAQKQDARDSMHKSIDPIVTKFDGKWIKVTADDLKGSSEESAKQYKCFTDAMQKVREDASLKELGQAYQKNQFITVTKELGSKDGSLGYEVSIDKSKAKEFGKQVENSSIAKAFKDCDDSTSSTSTSTDEDIDNTETKTFQLWISRWTHKVTRVVYEGTTTDSDETKADIKLDLTYNYSKPVTITAPTDATSLKDLIKSFESIQTTSGTV